MDNAEIIFPIRKKDLAERLGIAEGTIGTYKNTHGPKRGIIFVEGVDYIPSQGRRWASRYDTGEKWTKKGACKIAGLLSKQEAQDFYRKYCAEHNKDLTLKIKPEYFFLNIITNAIRGFIKYKTKFRIDNYEVDLYLPELKIAIECDEFMHENYNNKNEIKREETIEKLLNCKFIHFNPYDENINIKLGKIINMIFAAMHEQDISHFLAEYQRWTERDKERIKSELKAIEDAL